MALIKEYFELTEKYKEEYGSNTILLMQVGAFFEVYGLYDEPVNAVIGSNIVDFGHICDLSMVEKHASVDGKPVMMAGFKDLYVEKYVKKLQEAGYTSVVYVQDEAVKQTTRSLAGVFSPGTYFNVETTSLTNSTTCIWVELVENKILLKGKYVVIGIANIDIYTGKTNVFQFKEVYANNPTTYDELERFISIYNPSETIIISNLPNDEDIECIINYAGINSNVIHKINVHTTSSTKQERIKNCKKQQYQKEILTTFYKFAQYDIFIQHFHENEVAMQSLCYLLDFLHQHNAHILTKIAEPIFETSSKRLTLANHSLKQLNIINDGTVRSSKFSSVSQLLNECYTPMGKRSFAHTLLNPICDEVVLQREYDIIDYFLSVFEDYQLFLKSQLSTIKDISKWERQIYLKKITPKAFHNLYNNIYTIKRIYEKIEGDTVICNYLSLFDPMINSIKTKTDCDELTSYISDHLDLAIAKDIDQLQNFDTNFIQNGIDEDLDKKTLTLQESELKLNAIADYMSSLIMDTKAGNYVRVHETEKNNFSLVLTNRRCKLLQEVLPKEDTIVTLTYSNNAGKEKRFEFKISKKQFTFEKQSSTNNSIEDEQINQLCKNISTIKCSLKEYITAVYNRFVTSFEQHQQKLYRIIQFVTMIDVLYTKASIAKKYKYCKPVIGVAKGQTQKSFVKAKQLRHCLVERFQTDELYVTNDVVLGTENSDGILLYGTNAVGKTTIIRALGIAIIMAQAGLFVPATEFTYVPYKCIFTRILGNDNLFKGLSTFAVEMSELRTILRLCDENSLILGDELCSGTETQSAISIFVAGIQHLHTSHSSFIFATHLHEIVDYDEIVEMDRLKLKHMSVLYDKERELLIYDRLLKDGPGDSMYGLEVCKSLHLPQAFLDNAYAIRVRHNPENASILSLKTSRYNSKKIMGTCEKCGKHMGTEVHHLQHQSDANTDGIIKEETSVFHKNTLANLMTLCEKCHTEMHKTNAKGGKRVKTSKGTLLKDVKTTN